MVDHFLVVTMGARSVSVKNTRGLRLEGQFFPGDSISSPVALLEHGFASDMHQGGLFDAMAQTLNGNGIAVYRFNSTGVGKSEGSYEHTTLETLADDLNAKRDFVQGSKAVDAFNLLIVAHDISGALLAQENPGATLHAFTAPAYSPVDFLNRYLRAGRLAFPQETWTYREALLNEALWKSADKFSTDSWRNYRELSFVAHPTSDALISKTDISSLSGLLSRPRLIREYAGADHNFSNQQDRLAQDVTDYFEKAIYG